MSYYNMSVGPGRGVLCWNKYTYLYG